MKKILKILGVLVVLVVGIIGVVWFMTGDAVKVVDQQLTELRDGNYEAAYLLTTDEFQQATSQSEFTAFVKAYPALNQNTDTNFNDREANGDESILRGTLTAQDGSKLAVQYTLHKVDGDWLIHAIDVDDSAAGTNETTDQTSAQVNTFDEPGFGYTIDYPSTWSAEQSNDYTLLISGAEGTDFYNTTINVQNVVGDEVDTVVEDFQDQLIAIDPDAVVTKEKAYTQVATDGTRLIGTSFEITYVYQGTEVRQWQIVIPSADPEILYTWAYTAPVDIYADALDIATEILDSWAINMEV